MSEKLLLHKLHSDSKFNTKIKYSDYPHIVQ